MLAKEEAAATFFIIDRHLNAETAPIVRRMFDEGHAVALHSHTQGADDDAAGRGGRHADRRRRPHRDALPAVAPAAAFRPHGGSRSSQMYRGLAQIDYALVGWGWSLWDFNWYREPQPAGLAERLARRVSGGDIVVIHDGHHEDPRADRRYAVEAVALLLPQLQAEGFAFGTIC